MEDIKDFRKLEIYKLALEIIALTYRICKYLPKDQRYTLVPQMTEAALSVAANIAEGWGRYHYKDRIKFLYNSRGSLSELKNFVEVLKVLGFDKRIPEGLLDELGQRLEQEGLKLNNTINSLKKKV